MKAEKVVLRIQVAEISRSFFVVMFLVLGLMLLGQAGCRSASQYRLEADKTASEIVIKRQKELLGREGGFGIERPSDILRRRLLSVQGLVYAGASSLGTDQLETIEHWPEKDYPRSELLLDPIVMLEDGNESLELSLVEALQVGAENSFEYQTHKEEIFRAALALDLERNEFRNIFTGQIDNFVVSDTRGSRAVSGVENSGAISVSQKLTSGLEMTTALAFDLVNLLRPSRVSSFGVEIDSTISIPLLRGSGKHIVTESLTQAERDVVYAIYQFERFRRTFAVSVAREYLGVLRQLDLIQNNEENYRGLTRSAKRARRRADAGRLTEIQVDQAVQDELSARNGWINAIESYKRQMDFFKNLLGLPPDAKIELDRFELDRLLSYSEKFSIHLQDKADTGGDSESGLPDKQIVLEPADTEHGGPLELDENTAIRLAFENRLDLRVSQGRVYDAQRAVVVLADALGAELTLFGVSKTGGRRSLDSAGADNAKLRSNKGMYSGLLSLDLPFERTAERNAYRNSFIFLERAVRDVQILEDEIKISIRDKLRDLLESRETLLIQAMSVKLAEKRVRSTGLFLEAGRAQIRDILESQESLLSAQNRLTRAIIRYRVAELELQRDMGVLKIDDKGLWQEFSPEELIE